jgi:hypothetical protein
MALDYAKAMQLFMGTEDELARAVGQSVADVRSLRANPQRATPAQLERLGRVLIERGNGMKRVGEMLVEDSTG